MVKMGLHSVGNQIYKKFEDFFQLQHDKQCLILNTKSHKAKKMLKKGKKVSSLTIKVSLVSHRC